MGVVRYSGRLSLLLVSALGIPLVLWISWSWSYDLQIAETRQRANERLHLYASSLRGAIRQFEHVPELLARDPRVEAFLRQPAHKRNADQMSRMLAHWAQAAGASDIYLLDALGLTVAASNQGTPHSFMGNRYAFRPYYRDAIHDGRGRFYAVGTTTGRPGLFLSQRVRAPSGEILGVSVVKLTLEELQADWRDAGENVLVVDENGVIILSSHADWKYRTLDALTMTQRIAIRAARQFEESLLQPLGLRDAPGEYRVQIAQQTDGRYRIHGQALDWMSWRMAYLVSDADLRSRARNMVVGVSGALALIVTGGLWFRERSRRLRQLAEARDRLERRVQERTAELEARTRELEDTQEELVRSGKLVALGTLSAGMAHELNQPISAIRTYTASLRKLTEQGNVQRSYQLIERINGLTDRMVQIIAQLKVYVRQEQAHECRVDLCPRLKFVLELICDQEPLADLDIELRLPECAWVRGDDMRLEQILTNLLRNAIDAVRPQSSPWICIEVQRLEDYWRLSIQDNGPGFVHADPDRLFDPFYTTKRVGDGMGLGLFISYGIARDLGGDLHAERPPEGGARFCLLLPDA